MTQITKENLIQLLKQREVLVEFVKKNGTKRKMLCTLKSDELPAVHYKSIIPEKEHLLTVWDLEEESWRTLNFETELKLL